MSNRTSDHLTQSQDGYEITFHPAFARRCAVTPAGQAEKELYRQQETYKLPEGQDKPPTRHEIRYRSQQTGQELTLTVDDPHLRIARVVVELYGKEHEPGAGKGDEKVETVTIDNDTISCPPRC